VIERTRLRRLFLSAFRSHDLDYVDGGAQIEHHELTWTCSLIVDGRGATAPYRLVIGASVAQLAPEAPRAAEDCYLFLPLAYERTRIEGGPPSMPDAAFPDWPGSDVDRADIIDALVGQVVTYAGQVDSLSGLRERYGYGDFAGAFIIAPMRSLLSGAD
jgi:hypothetical protein